MDATIRTSGRETLRLSLGRRGTIAKVTRDGEPVDPAGADPSAQRTSINLPRHGGDTVSWSVRGTADGTPAASPQ
jgi:hypothetical protein